MFTAKMPIAKNTLYCYQLLVMIFLFSCSKAPTLINVKGHKKVLDNITTIIKESGLQTNLGIKIVELESMKLFTSGTPRHYSILPVIISFIPVSQH